MERLEGNNIVGHGDIATALQEAQNPNDLLYFASGVSNSAEERDSEYQREIDLLRAQPKDAHIVYFSSIATLNSSSYYFDHKRAMENRVRLYFPTHTIVRMGNISWGDNPHTLINYLKAHPEAEIRDEYRYICDKDEFLYWVNLIPEYSCEITIPGRRMKVAEIVQEIRDGKL